MGRDTTKASDHPSTNDLDKVDTGDTDISFQFGSRTIKLDRIPAMDDVFIMVLQVKVKGDGNKRNSKGELVPRRDLTILSGWEPGKQHLAESQTGMFDRDGKVTPQAAGHDEDDADDEVDTGDDDESGRSDNGTSEIAAEPYDDEDQGADNVVAFSDGEK